MNILITDTTYAAPLATAEYGFAGDRTATYVEVYAHNPHQVPCFPVARFGPCALPLAIDYAQEAVATTDTTTQAIGVLSHLLPRAAL